MSKLVLFDGNAIMHRAYHALPPLTGNKGQQINAVYGLISMLLRVIVDLKPTHIAYAFDRPEPTFRKKLLADYQGHRPEMENDLSIQFKIAQDVIKAFGIPVYDKAGYEADDVIGTIAQRAIEDSKISRYNDTKKGNKAPSIPVSQYPSIENVIIVTGDRDILQLVDDKVRLYMPVKGLSEGKLYGRNETVERMGVSPERIVDFKALVGDPSDNYKGVPGIGPKTAVKLINEYKSLDEIYKNLGNLPLKTRSLLQKNKDSAYVSHTLATIVKDVDIKIDFEKMGSWQLDSKEVLNKFEEIGFRTLTNRVKILGKKLEKEKQMTLL